MLGQFQTHSKNNYIYIFNLMMISRVMRLNRVIKYNNSMTKPKLTDYEYINKIQQSLLNNNVNQALKYLVNSYLDGVILDMQVFKNYYQRVKILEPGFSYEQVGYKIFRQSFKPHPFMLQWMNSLARSNNPSIINLLQKDFQNLKMQMPNVEKIVQQQPENIETQQKTGEKQQKQQSTQKKQQKSQNIKAIKQKKNQQQLQRIKQQKSTNPNNESISVKQSIIRNFMDRLHQTKSKLIVHNVVVEFNNNQSIQIGDYNSFYDEMTESKKQNEKVTSKTGQNNNSAHFENENQEDQDFQYQQEDDIGIRRIKIGKIQIIPNFNQDKDADK